MCCHEQSILLKDQWIFWNYAQPLVKICVMCEIQMIGFLIDNMTKTFIPRLMVSDIRSLLFDRQELHNCFPIMSKINKIYSVMIYFCVEPQSWYIQSIIFLVGSKTTTTKKLGGRWCSTPNKKLFKTRDVSWSCTNVNGENNCNEIYADTASFIHYGKGQAERYSQLTA